MTAVLSTEAEAWASTQTGKHVMHTLGARGDTRMLWSPDNPDEVVAAKRTFEELKAKGYSGFVVNEDGSAGGRMETFDPQAGRIIMTRPLQGG